MKNKLLLIFLILLLNPLTTFGATIIQGLLEPCEEGIYICVDGINAKYCKNSTWVTGWSCEPGTQCIIGEISQTNEGCHKINPFCSDGKCDSGEICSSCPQDCGECPPPPIIGEVVIETLPQNPCGNGAADVGENCYTCQKDVPCPNGLTCSSSGQCVGCITSNDCQGNNLWLGDISCSGDHRKILEVGIRTREKCVNGVCVERDKASTTRSIEDCGDKFCQDGNCGCNEGYEACVESGQCEKEKVLDTNAACSCDFQCNSGYCSDSKTCVNVLDVILSSDYIDLEVGDTTDITLSVSNNLNKEVEMSITLNTAGGEVTGIFSGETCSDNQCKLSRILPQRSRTDVSVSFTSDRKASFNISGTVAYVIENRSLEISKQIKINFKPLPSPIGIIIMCLLLVCTLVVCTLVYLHRRKKKIKDGKRNINKKVNSLKKEFKQLFFKESKIIKIFDKINLIISLLIISSVILIILGYSLLGVVLLIPLAFIFGNLYDKGRFKDFKKKVEILNRLIKQKFKKNKDVEKVEEKLEESETPIVEEPEKEVEEESKKNNILKIIIFIILGFAGLGGIISGKFARSLLLFSIIILWTKRFDNYIKLKRNTKIWITIGLFFFIGLLG